MHDQHTKDKPGSQLAKPQQESPTPTSVDADDTAESRLTADQRREMALWWEAVDAA